MIYLRRTDSKRFLQGFHGLPVFIDKRTGFINYQKKT
jgi:hypothetical protein